jgi:hypothetical protein
MEPSAASAANKGFIGDGAAVSYLGGKEATMKLAIIALATSFALSSTCVFAHTVHHGSKVHAHTAHRHVAPSVRLQPNYNSPNRDFSAYGRQNVWGQWGGYYGPMITTGAGGR